MKKILLFALVGLVSLTACKDSAEVAPTEDVTALQEQFHGKYKLLSSISSQALDLNQDGKASTNMLEELTELPDMQVVLSIYGKSANNSKPSFIFGHQWPKQEVDTISFQNEVRIGYAMQVVYWSFSFDRALTQLILKPQPAELNDPDLYTPPQAIKIKENNRIEVILTKRLYTTMGWKTVQIICLYERFIKHT